MKNTIHVDATNFSQYQIEVFAKSVKAAGFHYAPGKSFESFLTFEQLANATF